MKNNIVLIGPSGVGKTTIGNFISKRLSMELIDTDYLIEKKEGKSIDGIFEEKGENYFRKLEENIVKEIYSRESIVVSTGGGTILNPNNMKLLKENGQIFLLYGTLGSIIKNINSSNISRPLIENFNSVEEGIRKLLIDRKDIYFKYSDYIVYIDNKNVKEIGEEIINLI
ncbi:MAG TPA: shikimate kinase [Tissierellales bacterium]|nr:shikimate kinase [Tissierellales bacterium]